MNSAVVYARGPGLNSEVSLFNFRLGALVATQSGGTSFSGMASWTPTFIAKWIGVRGNFGVSFLRGEDNVPFSLIDYEVLLVLRFGRVFGIEGGGGYQSWNSNPAERPLVYTGGLFISLSKKPTGADKLYFNFSSVRLPVAPTNEIQIGIGVKF